MLFCKSKEVKNGKNDGDQYAILKFVGPSTELVTLPNGDQIEMAVKPVPVTVISWMSRLGTNAKLEAEGRQPFNSEGEYDFLNSIQEGHPTKGTVLTIEHEPYITQVGNQNIEMRASAVLVNGYPTDIDFNQSVMRACKAKGITPINTAYRSKNTVVGQVTNPIATNVDREVTDGLAK